MVKAVENPYEKVDTLPKSGWHINSPSFMYKRVELVLNPPRNLPLLGAKGLTSPEQTATGKGKSNPLIAGNLLKIVW